MNTRFTLAALGLVALWSVAASAQPVAPTPPVATPPPVMAPPPSAAFAPETPLGGGPYRAIMEADPRLPTHTVYRPANLAALGDQKLPIVVWGNGACANSGNAFRDFLTEIASYGYLVVAVGPIDTRPPGARPRPTLRPDGTRVLPPPETKSSQIIDGLNWAIAEAGRADSRYRGRLDSTRIAIMGQSCGGVQAIEASADPRTTTTVVWNSGMPKDGTSMAGGRALTKADLNALHAPIAYITGDDQDQAKPNAADDFERLSLPTFFGWERGVPHGGTYRHLNGGEFAGVGVAWLNWRLKGDAKAGRMFAGPDCGLCVNPRWVVKQKNLR